MRSKESVYNEGETQQ